MKSVYIIIQLLGVILVFGSFFVREFLITFAIGMILFIWGGVGYRKVQKEQKQQENIVACPYCKEMIQKDAIKCKHCSSDIEPTP